MVANCWWIPHDGFCSRRVEKFAEFRNEDDKDEKLGWEFLATIFHRRLTIGQCEVIANLLQVKWKKNTANINHAHGIAATKTMNETAKQTSSKWSCIKFIYIFITIIFCQYFSTDFISIINRKANKRRCLIDERFNKYYCTKHTK